MSTVEYGDKHPAELRHSDGTLVTALPGDVYGVTFSPDSRLFTVEYGDEHPTELRHSDGTLVTALPRSAGNATFSSDSRLFIVQYFSAEASNVNDFALWRSDGTLVSLIAGS